MTPPRYTAAVEPGTDDRLAKALVALRPVKGLLLAASERAVQEVRSCAGCDARCCRAGLNSMKVTRLEAEALARRLEQADLVPLLPEILARSRAEVAKRRLAEDPDATYDCPLLTADGRCLVHGPAQPAGCLSFRPVADGGCDHDRDLFARQEPAMARADRIAFGRVHPVESIPEALLRRFCPTSKGRGRRPRRR